MTKQARQSDSAPGQFVLIGLLALFVCIAVIRRLTTPALWDPTTGTVHAPQDVLTHWPDGRLDINTATEAELCLLSGIGPARARAIVEERDRNGDFESPADLDRVHGIGLKTIDWFDDAIVFHPGESGE